MPSFPTYADTQGAIDDWRITAVEEVDDIGGCRYAAPARLGFDRDWPQPPHRFREHTVHLVSCITASYPKLDPTPLQDVYDAVQAWHEDHNASRVPDQRILQAALDRAVGTLQAIEHALQTRRSTKPSAAPSAATSTAAAADGDAASEYDVFICHASEDKTAVVVPLTDELVKRGLRAWVDYRELRVGDKLRERIEDGLRRSRSAIVVVSPRFFAKQWPQTELDGLVALEMADRRKRILPIWHEVDYADVAQHSPTLAGRLAAKWADGLSQVADEIVRAVRG